MKILIIGDTCIDVFQYGICKRLSPEAPVPVFNPTYSTETSGMAGNVYNNFIALGVERCDIITNEIKPIKTRFVDEHINQQIMRMDENDQIDRINFKNIGNIWDAIVISDYDKGFLKESDIEYIGDVAKRSNVLTFLDTKKKLHYDNMDFLKNIDFIKINESEYKNNKLELTEGAWFFGELIVTLGSRGAMYKNEVFETNVVDVSDLSGAGDTFFASFVYEYLKTNDIKDAIKFANKCSSWVVTQKGIAVIDKTKI